MHSMFNLSIYKPLLFCVTEIIPARYHCIVNLNAVQIEFIC